MFFCIKLWLISGFSCNERMSLCIFHAYSAVRVLEDCSPFISINIPVLQKVLCNLERLVTFWFQPYFLPLSSVSLLFFCSSHLLFSPSVSSSLLFLTIFFISFFRACPRFFSMLLYYSSSGLFSLFSCFFSDFGLWNDNSSVVTRPPSPLPQSLLPPRLDSRFRKLH